MRVWDQGAMIGQQEVGCSYACTHTQNKKKVGLSSKNLHRVYQYAVDKILV